MKKQEQEQEQEKVSTKKCPKCKNERLLLLRTFKRKVCTDCNPYTWIVWELDKDQQPLQ